MKKIIFLFLAVTMCIIIWQNRINIVIWSIPKILNVVRPISSEGNSDWQEGPIEKDRLEVAHISLTAEETT